MKTFFLIFSSFYFCLSQLCEDRIAPGKTVSDCPNNLHKCKDPIWMDLMRQECPKSCNFCSLAQAKNCRDSTAPNGISECPQSKYKCTDPIYRDFMRQECPYTCGFCNNKTLKTESTKKKPRKPNVKRRIRLVDFPPLTTSINPNVDPCTNFYQHICTGRIEYYKQSFPDKKRFLELQIPEPVIKARTIDMLSSRVMATNDEYFPMALIFHQNCLNVQKHEADRTFSILKEFKRLAPSLAYNVDMLIATFPLTFFYTIMADANKENSNRKILEISTEGKNSLVEDPMELQSPNLRKFLHDVYGFYMDDDAAQNLQVFVPRLTDAQINARIDSYIAVETGRLNILNEKPVVASANILPTSIYMTLDQLQKTVIKNFNFAKLFQTFIPSNVLASLSPTGLMDLMVAAEDVSLLSKIDDYFQQIPPQQMAEYLEVDILLYPVTSMSFALDSRFEKAFFEFKPLQPGEKQSNLTEICLKISKQYFSHLIDKQYIAKYFDAKTKQDVENMVDYIADSLRDMLETNSWMDETTRKKALEKLDLMTNNVGYFDIIFDDAEMKLKYGNIKLDPSFSFYEMNNIIAKSSYLNLFNTLADMPSFFNTALDTNAFYAPQFNSLFIAAGILEGSTYDVTFPEAYNYGAIGMVVGHEMTHGYDNNGHKVDGYGNIKDWWDSTTLQEYNRLTNCFVEQYSREPVRINETYTQTINGELTQGENVADAGGMRAAYQAMEMLFQENKKIRGTVKFRGLESFTDEQLFFAAFAFNFCGTATPDVSLYLLANDPHSPQEARVNVALRNTEQFAAAFKCPKNSPMNPAQRCRLW